MKTTLAKPIAATAFLALLDCSSSGAAETAGLELPPGFSATVFADGLEGVRGLAASPDGNVYGRLRDGGVAALRDADGDGAAETVERMREPSARGSGIAVDGGFLYVSTDSAVHRAKLSKGALLPGGKFETVVDGLPDQRQHSSKMLAFDGEGRLFVEVGSPSNALGNPDRARGAKGLDDAEVEEFLSRHGGVWRFDSSKLGQTQADGLHWSTGHRHLLSLAWHPKSAALFGAQNGRDVIDVVAPSVFTTEYNATRVAEEFHILPQGANLGWPYTFYDPIDKKRLYSPEYGGDGKKGPAEDEYPAPLVAFPAHWAPMQMVHYGADAFPERYRGGMFLAFHGSWNRAPEQAGYRVCFIPFGPDGMPSGGYETFADGFIGAESITNPGDAKFRPMGLAVGPDGALYIGADQGGRIWRVTYAGE